MNRTEDTSRRVALVEIEAILAKVQQRLPEEEYIVLDALFESYRELTFLLSQKTATLARLRKLFHIETTERLDSKPDATTDKGAASNDANASTTSTSSDPNDTPACASGSSVPNANDEPKASSPKKGHGRNSGSAYKGSQTHIEHPDIKAAGQVCPNCDSPSLLLRGRTKPKPQISGRPLFDAHSYTADSWRCSKCGETFTAQLPEEAKGPKYKPSATAILIYMHYLAGLPFQRIQELQRDIQIPMPVAIQWKLVDEAATRLKPLHEQLLNLAAQGTLIHIDDSPMRISELMGKRRAKAIEKGLIKDPTRTGIRTTGWLSFDSNAPPIALFFTGIQHAGENLADMLDKRLDGLPKPMVMSDALGHNVPASVKGRVIEVNCMAHGRRGVFDQLESFPFEARYVLVELAKVFANDTKAKADGLTPEERLRLHQRNSGAIMGRLRKWIRNVMYQQKIVEENSDFGRNLKYILKHWKKLIRFLRIPAAPLTNNICERLLKTAIRYRKNSGCYKTVHGAEVGDQLMSLMQTARLNSVDPFRYILALLEHLDEVADAPQAWLPWCYQETLAATLDNRAEGQAA